jgi:hypothetical protein
MLDVPVAEFQVRLEHEIFSNEVKDLAFSQSIEFMKL